jgi:type IV secretory pathway VirB9-like protein
MKLRWLIPVAVLIPLRLSGTDAPVKARVATITINPREVTVLHLRPEFESTIRMPEEITSVILGNPGEFKAEHNEGESEYVYVKPIVKVAAQSNLLIATKSGQHVTLELISDGVNATIPTQPVDFLIEYKMARSFLDHF